MGHSRKHFLQNTAPVSRLDPLNNDVVFYSVLYILRIHRTASSSPAQTSIINASGTNIKHTKQSKTAIQKSYGVCDEQTLVGHSKNRNKYA
jgi:hypothetical protein